MSEFTSTAGSSSDLMSSRRGASKGEERALASKLFGNLGTVSLVADGAVDDGGLFGKASVSAAMRGGAEPTSTIGGAGGTDDTQPSGVWEDPDDLTTTVNVTRVARLRKLRTGEADVNLDGNVYQARVRTQHKRIHQRTDWATVGEDQKGDGKETTALTHLLKEGGALVDEDGGLASEGRTLPQGSLEATRVRDANAAEPSNAVLRSVEFHANGALFLTAGLDKTLRLFDIDGTNNPKTSSVFFDDLPIHKATFSNNGMRDATVLLSGRRKYFYVYDLHKGAVERVAPLIGRGEKSLESFVCQRQGAVHNDPIVAFLGADGHVPLVSLRSKSCVGSVKMNGTCRSASFSGDGNYLLTAGGDGGTYLWDLRNQNRCVERVVDDGALTVTALANSPSGAHCAMGSDAGVVNVYKGDAFKTFRKDNADVNKNIDQNTMQRSTRITPEKALMSLTTSVDNLSFNGDGQMLAMSSRLKRDALRIVHLPSCTVFSNWPSSKTPLHYVWCTAFSPTGGYLAVGNARGRALLYRIHAYGTGGKEEE